MELFGHRFIKYDYNSSGLTVRKKSIDSITGGGLNEAYKRVVPSHAPHLGRDEYPDFRWRAHTAVWAAQAGLSRPGIFVELGVHTGFLSHMICECLGFDEGSPRFLLFDTFEGIPVDQVPEADKARAIGHNEDYADVFDVTSSIFEPYPTVELVRGALPGTLQSLHIDQIAYLAVDLNYAAVEMDCIEMLWHKLSPGCVVVLDDYAWKGHEAQKCAWDEWAARENRMVYTVPTGQGLIIK